MEYAVRDGVRTLKFHGTLLSEASSYAPGKTRWVEFQLYKTVKDQYVLSRIGYSVVYHSQGCKTVYRNNLSPVDGLELPAKWTACDLCNPSRANVEGVFPETPRYAALHCVDAIGVVASLIKEDDNGVEYLTNVARVLLTEASQVDDNLRESFLTDYIT